MANKVAVGDAEKILADVPADKVFVVSDGKTIRNLHELERAIEFMSDGTFSGHVRDQRNDFAQWVAEVLKDFYLSAVMMKTHSKTTTAQRIRARISSLERVLDTEHDRKTAVLVEKTFWQRFDMEFILITLAALLIGMVIGVLLEYNFGIIGFF